MDTLPTVQPEFHESIVEHRPVFALESTLISHGLPAPLNLECARKTEEDIRAAGAVPATIAVIDGQIRVGLTDRELERLAEDDDVEKLSRDNLATAVAEGITGATTVAASMICAHKAGITVFATGGIGGVHRGWQQHLDISADLIELARTNVTVVCSGAKSLLDLPATLELLETLGVPVIGLGTDELPAFFSRESGLVLRQTARSVSEAAAIIASRRTLGLEGGEVLAVPPPVTTALPQSEVDQWIDLAIAEARVANIRGKSMTPFLLERLAKLSVGRTLTANVALIEHNAVVAAALAIAYADYHNSS